MVPVDSNGGRPCSLAQISSLAVVLVGREHPTGKGQAVSRQLVGSGARPETFGWHWREDRRTATETPGRLGDPVGRPLQRNTQVLAPGGSKVLHYANRLIPGRLSVHGLSRGSVVGDDDRLRECERVCQRGSRM